MTGKNRGGRPSIFGSKAGGYRVQGLLTKTSQPDFERARRQLAKLVKPTGWSGPVSDADTIHFLAWGIEKTKAFLKVG